MPKGRINVYNIYDNIIHIHCASEGFLELVHKYWGRFYCAARCAKPRAVFYIDGSDILAHLKNRQCFYNDHLYVLLDSTKCITCDLQGSPWQVYIQAADLNDINFVYFYLFEPIFFNILKRLGLFYLHSACVSRNGCGILIPAETTSGKTTAALSLIRAGAEFLADDGLFLKEEKDGVYALGSDDRMFVTDKTISLFPELGLLKQSPSFKKGDRLKQCLDAGTIKTIYSRGPAKQARIGMIVFPRIAAGRKTRIRPVPRARALINMLRQTPKEFKGIVRDSIAITKQFELYSRVTGSAAIYDLFIGKGAGIIPELVFSSIKEL